MARDIISDILNEMMNAKKANKTFIETTRFSKLLIKILEMMKSYGYIEYKLEDGKLRITLKEITECRSIKPRYTVAKKDVEKYVRKFLPARNYGYILISTSKGLMTHQEAQENKIGGSLIAYFF